MKSLQQFCVILSMFAILGWSSTAYAQADFYKGKTITVIAGTTAGALSIDGLLSR